MHAPFLWNSTKYPSRGCCQSHLVDIMSENVKLLVVATFCGQIDIRSVNHHPHSQWLSGPTWNYYPVVSSSNSTKLLWLNFKCTQDFVAFNRPSKGNIACLNFWTWFTAVILHWPCYCCTEVKSLNSKPRCGTRIQNAKLLHLLTFVQNQDTIWNCLTALYYQKATYHAAKHCNGPDDIILL